MKSERRHELQQNELAGWLAKKIEAVKPHTASIGGVLIVGLVLGAVAYYFISQSAAERDEVWHAYNVAKSKPQPSRNDFQEIVDNNPDSDVALMAQQRLAVMQKNTALPLFLSDPATAKKRLADAAGNFSAVLEKSKDVMAQQFCAFELARTRESLLDLKGAKEQYQELVDRWPESAFADASTKRIEAIESASVRDFYAWYRSTKRDPFPTRSSTKTPGDFLKGLTSDFPDDPKDLPVTEPSPREETEETETSGKDAAGEEAEDEAASTDDKPEKPE